jgi:hypothetical protein
MPWLFLLQTRDEDSTGLKVAGAWLKKGKAQADKPLQIPLLEFHSQPAACGDLNEL